MALNDLSPATVSQDALESIDQTWENEIEFAARLRRVGLVHRAAAIGGFLIYLSSPLTASVVSLAPPGRVDREFVIEVDNSIGAIDHSLADAMVLQRHLYNGQQYDPFLDPDEAVEMELLDSYYTVVHSLYAESDTPFEL